VTSPVTSGLDSTNLTSTLLSPPIAVGLAAYALGLSVEAISEFQRKAFKQDPKNKGKPYGGGLFSLATNVNYGAYTIWRAAYALTCGGFVWGATTFTFFFWDFVTRGVPVLDEYMCQRVSLVELLFFIMISNEETKIVRRCLPRDQSPCSIRFDSWDLLRSLHGRRKSSPSSAIREPSIAGWECCLFRVKLGFERWCFYVGHILPGSCFCKFSSVGFHDRGAINENVTF
jgi:hypothetical protein